MFDVLEITKLLAERSIPVTGASLADTTSPDKPRVYVFVPVHRDSDNRQQPSNLQLSRAKEELGLRGIDLDFVLTDGDRRDVEAGLRATLLHSFGSLIRNSFLSVAKQRATVWLDLKAGLDSTALNAITIKAQIFLNEVGLSLGEISSTAADNLPTSTSILLVIRRASPVTAPAIKTELQKGSLTVPSDDWLSRRLDLLRKHGSVVRNHDGSYALSYQALKQLGSGKDSESPDVNRLLRLATAGK